MASAWYINDVKYSEDSTKTHLSHSIKNGSPPLPLPPKVAKFATYASIVRYGSPQVFVDELWYADEMVARVTKTDTNIIDFEVFNPISCARTAKLMCASRLLFNVVSFGTYNRSVEGHSLNNLANKSHHIFNPISAKQKLKVDKSQFNYRIDGVSYSFGQMAYGRPILHVSKNLGFGRLFIGDFDNGIKGARRFLHSAKLVLAMQGLSLGRRSPLFSYPSPDCGAEFLAQMHANYDMKLPPSLSDAGAFNFIMEAKVAVLSAQVDGSPVSIRTSPALHISHRPFYQFGPSTFLSG